MSKKLWLPPTKFGVSNPAVRPMPKIRIKGVERNSIVGQQLLDMFAGQVGQFHLAGAHNYSSAPQAIFKAQRESDDIRMRYTNLQGQEIIDIEVNPAIVEHLQRQPTPAWDFALIELYVPNMHRDDGAETFGALAHLTTPVEAELTPASTWPVRGVAMNTLGGADPDPMLHVAESGGIVRTTSAGETEVYASFTVDLRPARGLPIVTLGLHAAIGTRTPSFPPAQWYTIAGAEITSSPTPASTTPSAYNQRMTNSTVSIVTYPDRVNNVGHFLPHVWSTDSTGTTIGWIDAPGDKLVHTYSDGVSTITYVPLPTAYFDTSDETWKFDATDSQFYSQYMGGSVQSSGGIDTSHDWWRHWMVKTAIGNYTPPYAGPEAIPAEVQVTLFMGVPELDVTQYDGDLDYNRWTFTQTFPLRPGHMVVGDTAVPTYDAFLEPLSGTVYELLGIPKLGTVIIDPIKGGAFWQAV